MNKKDLVITFRMMNGKLISVYVSEDIKVLEEKLLNMKIFQFDSRSRYGNNRERVDKLANCGIIMANVESYLIEEE